ncbi:MAG: NapC/NirT family cytochrome c [Nitrospirae bacterium]|nr:NapC/NirT family cytochrome c [Nitrospirota bacterium]
MIPVKIRRRFEELIENMLEHIKGVVLFACIIVGFLSAIVGYRYYRYSQDDPQFCASCHPMKEAYSQWQRGKHRDVVCQQCHQLSMIEKDRLLIAYVLKGHQPLAQTHGREKPWETCRDCHLDNLSDGSGGMRKSYGHARHVVMQKLKCKGCHGTIALHNFGADETVCRNCHKGVHTAGMNAGSCLKCHPF